MPVEYVYKITIDDSDLQLSLKNIDMILSNLGNRTATAFDKVGTSMGTGVKKAAGEAKKALADVEKSQKAAASAASKTEKAYIKLLAAELKLAAGSDKAAQEFIKQAAAGSQSADALGILVAKSTSLTQAQVQQAQTIAFVKNQIKTLSAAMAEEGAATEALIGRISEYQAILERIINSKETEKAATEASVAAKKAEATAVAKAADEIAKAQATSTAEIEKADAVYKKLLVSQLKLAAGTDKSAKEMINSAAAGSQSVETLLKVVNASGQMSEAQVTAAEKITKLKNAIAVTTAVMEQGGSATEDLETRIEMLNGMLNRQIEIRDEAIQSAKDMAQAEQEAGDAVDDAAGDIGDGLGDISEGAEKSERSFVSLLAAQLKAAAGADENTKKFIALSAATAQTGDALLTAVGTTERLSQAQIDQAVKVATLQQSIKDLTAELDKEGASTEELEEQIAAANGELEAMEEAQQNAAAAAQAMTMAQAAEQQAVSDATDAIVEAQEDRAKAEKLTAIRTRQANREFTKLAKSFPEIKQALVELTGQYGTFKTEIGGTAEATGNAQQELQKLFKDNPKFTRELDELTKKWGTFTATINRADFGPRMKSTGQQVRQLGFALQRMGIGGVAAFGEIFAALGPIGIAIGAIIVPIIAITKALKKLAEEAVAAFKKITKEAFEAAKEFETTEAAFKAIFKAADASVIEGALRSVRKESERLGVSLEELLPKILPKVSTLEQAFEVAELIPGLAASAIDLGPMDALRSTVEGLAGDLVSLRKAFEIDVTGIRAAQKEFGLVEGYIIGLGAELEAMGLTFDAQAETINVKIGQMQERWQSFKLLMGEPLVDAVKDQFEGLFDLLDENEDTIENIAIMIGTIVANLGTKLAGGLSDALAKIDPEDIERVANALGKIADVIVGQIADVIGLFTGGGGIADFAETMAEIIEYADTWINLFKQLHTIGKQLNDLLMIIPNAIFGLIGSLVGMETEMGLVRFIVDALGKALKGIIAILGVVTGAFAATTGFVRGFVGGIVDVIKGSKNLGEALEAAMKAGTNAMKIQLQTTLGYLEDYEEVTLDAAGATRELGEVAGLTANDILALNNAMRQLAEGEEDFLEQQKEINEKIADFARDAESKFQEILTDLGRDLLDAQIANQRKLIDLETKNLQAIQDIRRGYDNDVLAAAVDLGDDEADIARKHGREMADIETDLNKARLKIEQDYLDDLERMRAKFDFDMFEAFLANDAKRLAQLRRRQAFEEKEAKKDRDRGIRDVDDKAQEQREARKLTLEQELEDARIASARVIRDLATALADQFAEQEINRKRDVEAQALANKRKEEDMRDSFDRQILDYNDWWKERHRKTTEAIAEDLEAMQKYVDDRNEILDTIQSITEVASQIPLEQLRTMTAERLAEVTNLNLQQAQVGLPPGQQQGQTLDELLPYGITGIELTAATLADKTREELERVFNEASLQLGLPTLMQQQALDLILQDMETRGFHAGPMFEETQRERLAGMSEEQVRTFISELTAELAGIIIPEMPEGFEAMFPEGFSVPITAAAPGGPPSGVYGATGGYATGPPLAQPPPGYGFPPTLPAEFAQLENFFLPGNLMPIPPTYGFDAETYFDLLDDQTEAQAQAELDMRGEIADTVNLAALLAEERASLHASYLDDEVASSQVASDAQIEILEKTLIAQREALAAIRGDPELQVDINALEVSIGVLEDLIARAREQQTALAEETAQAEVDAVLTAEEVKRDETETTSEALEAAMERRLGTIERTTGGEISAAEEAAGEQVGLTEARLATQGAMTGEFRELEYTAQADAEEARAELIAASEGELLDMQYGWWGDLLRVQGQGIENDLRLMVRWLEERQRVWQAMQLTMPGSLGGLDGDGPQLPGVGGGDDDGGGQISLEQLQNMAISFAQQLGYEMGLVRAEIVEMTYSELVDFVAYLQEQIAAQGYALGGGFLPNKPLLVGENEAEIVEFNSAGRITPISAFMERPPSRLAGIGETNIDQSLHLEGLTFPDPRGISPSVLAAMENVAANVALKVWSKRRR